MIEVGNFTWLDASAVGVALALSGLMFQRRIRNAEFWRATVTPLASIIGSGFLIVAPLLAAIVGSGAVITMVGIVMLSLWVGSALRFNIVHDGTDLTGGTVAFAPELERASDLALALAYLISIAFYIRLMCGFLLTGFQLFTEFNGDVLASAVLAFIGGYGALRGLKGLERLEEYSVTIKLAIIGALLFALAFHALRSGYVVTHIHASVIDGWDRLRLVGGTLLIVQGFETSKYLESAYTPAVRLRSMLWAQLLAGVIYVAFVSLALPLMASLADSTPSETAIIDIARQATPVLPLMLIVAATMSQFSAAIADTLGAGGVVEVNSKKRLRTKVSYPIITCVSVILVWSTDIFEIVALASRAFAIYYFLQAVLAIRLSASFQTGTHRKLTIASYGTLAAVLLAIVIFAKAVET